MRYPNDPIRRDRMQDGFPTSIPAFHDIPPTAFHDVEPMDGPPPSFFHDVQTLEGPPPLVFDDAANSYYGEPVVIPAPAPASLSHDLVAPDIIQERHQLGEVRFVTSPSALSSVAVAMARAVTGIKEICLMSEKSNAVHQRYILVTKVLNDPSKQEKPKQEKPLVQMVKPKRKRGEAERPPEEVPLDLDAAMVEFDAAVAEAFPPAVLRNNKTVPIHVELMRPKK